MGWPMEVQHGRLSNVYGRSVKHGGFTFMGAHVVLDGTGFSLAQRLSDHIRGREPPVLRHPVENGFDAAWVRARIPNTFGFTPEKAEVEKALLNVGFVAVPEGEAVCYPFVCIDHYGRTGLMFSDEGPEEFIKQSIAAGFWGLLAQEPENVSNFEERVYHPGAGVWLTFGCEDGRVYCDESDE